MTRRSHGQRAVVGEASVVRRRRLEGRCAIAVRDARVRCSRIHARVGPRRPCIRRAAPAPEERPERAGDGQYEHRHRRSPNPHGPGSVTRPWGKRNERSQSPPRPASSRPARFPAPLEAPLRGPAFQRRNAVAGRVPVGAAARRLVPLSGVHVGAAYAVADARLAVLLLDEERAAQRPRLRAAGGVHLADAELHVGITAPGVVCAEQQLPMSRTPPSPPSFVPASPPAS